MEYFKSLKIADYLIFLSSIIGVIFYRRLRPRYMKWVLLMLLVTLFFELVTPLKLIRFQKNNYSLYNIFNVVQHLLFALIFYHTFTRHKQKIMVIIFSAMVCFFAIMNYLFIQRSELFNSYTYSVSCIFLTINSFAILMRLYSPDRILNFFLEPIFWLAVGILFFFPVSLFGIGLVAEMYEYNPELATQFYYIAGLMNVVLYGFCLVALVMTVYRNKPALINE